MNMVKRWWSGINDSIQDIREDWRSPNSDSGRSWYKVIIVLLVIYLLVAMGVGVYWDREPDLIDVAAELSLRKQPVQPIRGVAVTATMVTVANTLLDKPGGFLTNDILPPGVWLDNMPNWEYGVLIQLRDMSKAMREAFSRSQSQSTEDTDLAIAESRFNFDNNSWAVPATESEYREGIQYLQKYLKRLEDADEMNAQFYARADNLRYWLGTAETRLGSLSQRLSASVGQRRLNTDLAGESEASQSTQTPREREIKTPWNEIDDVFYEARGTTWALVHFLKAIEIDFADVLQKKNALVSLQQIIRELEATQETVFSPLILNGSGFGFLANHSLVMASYISRANAGIIDLRELLSQG